MIWRETEPCNTDWGSVPLASQTCTGRRWRHVSSCGKGPFCSFFWQSAATCTASRGERSPGIITTNMLHRKSDRIGGSYLIVDLKFLDHSQLDEHPQSGRDHGVDVQGEIVKGELVDAQLTHQGNVGGLLDHCWRGHKGEERVWEVRGSCAMIRRYTGIHRYSN